MKRRVWLIVCSLLIICVIWYDHSSRSHPVNTEINLNNILSNQGDQDFARADKPRTFNFPDDHFAHPEYRIEWWYLTGNLSSDTGHQFGYQITFFRTALKSKPAQRESKWASHQIWMAHLAVSDVNQQQHYQTQRLSRPAIGLAGIQQQPFKIWLEDWQITGVGNGNFPWHIIAKDQKISLDLTVNPLKPAVLQGNQGLSQKSSEPGNASYYYSFTRMDSTGTIKVNHKTYKVKGLSWLDREWSTSALDKNQSGWDWFSLQLNTGEELMFYRLRSKTGDSDQQSQGKWIHADGKTISLTV
ncbi:MAG: carotenoid 1,2-hydratase, partial [Gammaproteobacteria bacterium]|nr:carotenoid 1,2-hydratase [Gammaproteobacteria bacterium]